MKSQRRWLSIVATTMALTLPAQGQSPNPSFEVASVKYRGDRSQLRGDPTPPVKTSPNTFYRAGETLDFLVRYAYDLQKFEVEGGPDWVRDSVYEINAKSAGAASTEQQRLMLRALLEERFRLVVHQEQRVMRHQALVVAREDGRLGPALQRCDPNNVPAPKAIPIPRGGDVAKRTCGRISEIAARATGVLGSPVVDRTGLTGLWNFELTYERPSRAERERERGFDVDLPSFPAALQEQLGLRLRSVNGP
jgi:uncharacterized protein (TIGR03435 family)